MRDVTLVEVHADGRHLILTDESGQRFRLPLDDQLRAAARQDVAWLNRLQAGVEQPLRPRDIQARIRAGLSADEIAEATGMSVEHVRRYEGPVLAEREHVAQAAQQVAVARSGSSDTTLTQSVAERLAARGADSDPVWDSWREEAGSWIVQVGFSAGGRPRTAQWRYLPADAHLEPIDDESRWLSVTPEPERSTPGVTERVFDVSDGNLHEQAEGPVRADAAGVRTLEEDPQNRTLDLLDALRGRRGRRLGTEDPEQPDVVDALFAEDDDDMLPPPAHPPASRPDEAVDAAILSLRDPSRRPTAQAEVDLSLHDTGAGSGAGAESRQAGLLDNDLQDTPAPADEQPAGRRSRKRASVPSWDDIMFGAKRD